MNLHSLPVGSFIWMAGARFQKTGEVFDGKPMSRFRIEWEKDSTNFDVWIVGDKGVLCKVLEKQNK